MNKTSALTIALSAALAMTSTSAALAWPGKKAKPAPAPVAAPAPAPEPAPPPPPPAQITMASRFVDYAAAFSTYMDRAGGIRADYIDGPGVANALRIGEASEPGQLQQGMIAYAALVALKDQSFVDQVRVYAANPQSRELITARLISDPNYVGAIPHVDSAAGLVVANLAAQGLRVNAAGVAVKQSAYDVQHQSWSKSPVANREARLQEAKTLSATPLVITEADRSRVVSIPMSATGQTAPIAGPYTPSVARALTLAALAVLGKAGDDNADQVAPVLLNTQDAFCLNMSKLNLYQCLATARHW
jgi:hypothetical protein